MIFKRRHAILLGTNLALVVCYVQRSSFSLAAVEMRDQLGWTDAEKNTTISAFYWGYMPLMMPGGYLVLRYGGFAVLAFAVLASSLLTAATPLAAPHGVTWVYALRAVTGAVEAATFPAVFDLIARWVPATEKGSAIGVVFAGVPVGNMLAFGLTGWVCDAYGWEAAFYLFAVTSLP